MKKETIIRESIQWGKAIGFAFIVAIFVQSQVLAFTTVQQYSMENTYFENDKLLLEKVSYKINEPERGDILVFRKEQPEGLRGSSVGIVIEDYIGKITRKQDRERMIKRVIGIAGDVVDIKQGSVYVNGQVLEEDYVHDTTKAGELPLPMKVPEGYVFVLGDNRNNSLDSRDYGCVSMDKVEGKVIFKVN